MVPVCESVFLTKQNWLLSCSEGYLPSYNMVDIMTFQEGYLTGFSFLLDQKFTDFTVLIFSLKVEIQDNSEQLCFFPIYVVS